VLFLIFTLTGIRQKLIDAIPERMKVGLALSVGVFIAIVALKISNVVVYDGVRFKALGSFSSATAIVLYVGFGIAYVLDRYGVRSSVLLSIVTCFALTKIL